MRTGSLAGPWPIVVIHGSGSPAAEKIQMFREHDTEACVELARAALTGRAAIGEREPQPV